MDESVTRIPIVKVGDAFPQGIELFVDDSGLKKSSRDQPEARHYCPEPGCEASFKRKYDIDRHYQAKHTQSKNFFCPVQGCQFSLEPDLASVNFGGIVNLGFLTWPQKSKQLAHEDDKAYARWLLYGFHRKDKMLKHLAESHKNLDLSSLLEKAACQDDPILAETQGFCVLGGSWPWRRTLGRIKRKDGSWMGWSGFHYAEVAAAGFEPWVNRWVNSIELDIRNGTKASWSTPEPSPKSAVASTQGFGSSSTPSAGFEIVDVSPGLAMDLVATQPTYGSFASSSMGRLITNDYNQGVLWPTQQLSQASLFPSHGQFNNWTPPLITDFNFGTEFMAPMQMLQPNGNIPGPSTNMLDFNNTPFQHIQGHFEMPANDTYGLAETAQATTADSDASNIESWDSFFDLGSDTGTGTWNPNNDG